MKKQFLKEYGLIVLGSMMYAIGVGLFVFPHSLLLGGTGGISVILHRYITFSPGTILMAINFLLVFVAFIVLGKEMGIKTVVGSTLTAVFIGIAEKIFSFPSPFISNIYVSAVLGAAVIAVSSGMLFYVDSNSGGTDVVALIVKKYAKIDVGKALLITDIFIVVWGGIVSGYIMAIASFVGLLIKTLGIDFVINTVKKYQNRVDSPPLEEETEPQLPKQNVSGTHTF